MMLKTDALSSMVSGLVLISPFLQTVTLLGATALRDQLLIEALEQGFMAFMPGQLLSKQPDGPGIGNLVFQVAP